MLPEVTAEAGRLLSILVFSTPFVSLSVSATVSLLVGQVENYCPRRDLFCRKKRLSLLVTPHDLSPALRKGVIPHCSELHLRRPMVGSENNA